MTTHWEPIWEFKTDRFTVICDVAPEDLPPEDCFDPEHCADDIEAIREGRIDWFMVRCRVLMDHKFEIGSDYLGGCAYSCASDFIGDGYFRDMIRQSINYAREYLKKYPLPYQRAA